MNMVSTSKEKKILFCYDINLLPWQIPLSQPIQDVKKTRNTNIETYLAGEHLCHKI